MRLGKHAVEEQQRKAVDERPGGDRGDVDRLRGRAGMNAALIDMERTIRGLLELGIFAAIGEIRAEHQAKQAATLEREGDIGAAHRGQRVGFPPRGFLPIREVVESLRRQRGEQRFLVGEMAVGRRRRNPDAPRRLAQADRGGAAGVEQGACGGNQRLPQIAMVIGTTF